MSRPAREMIAMGVAVLATCVGFVFPPLQWLFYLPGMFARQVMILIGLAAAISPWLAIALETGFNVLVFFAFVYLATAPLGKQTSGA
ncbi:MAG: hypothetical protein ACHQPI_14155 [Thermoanaerobaculia bacterium]